jgi:pimeloyl-ACP methyl ester carboxylesterase
VTFLYESRRTTRQSAGFLEVQLACKLVRDEYSADPHRARRVVISDVGHLLYLEKPGEFSRIVIEFLEDQ